MSSLDSLHPEIHALIEGADLVNPALRTPSHGVDRSQVLVESTKINRQSLSLPLEEVHFEALDLLVPHLRTG